MSNEHFHILNVIKQECKNQYIMNIIETALELPASFDTIVVLVDEILDMIQATKKWKWN